MTTATFLSQHLLRSTLPSMPNIWRSSVLQCVAVCCSVLQCVAVCCRAHCFPCQLFGVVVCCSVLQCVAVRCSVLQCVAICCNTVQCVAVCCSVLQCVVVCCSVLQSSLSFTPSVWRSCVLQCVVVVCCSALQCSALQCSARLCSVVQCVAVCCGMLWCVASTCSPYHMLGVVTFYLRFIRAKETQTQNTVRRVVLSNVDVDLDCAFRWCTNQSFSPFFLGMPTISFQ